MSTSAPKPPEILDKIVDIVLAHKPKAAKAKVAKKRKKVAKKQSRRTATRRVPSPNLFKPVHLSLSHPRSYFEAN
jgi:hypothetical protein